MSDHQISEGRTVRVRSDVLANYTTEWAKKLGGRAGVVERIFTPLGSNRAMARVKWLKRGNRGKEFVEVMNARDLEPQP